MVALAGGVVRQMRRRAQLTVACSPLTKAMLRPAGASSMGNEVFRRVGRLSKFASNEPHTPLARSSAEGRSQAP